jgi:hypothetical protein
MTIHSKYSAKTVQPSSRGARPVAATAAAASRSQKTACTTSEVGSGSGSNRPTSSGWYSSGGTSAFQRTHCDTVSRSMTTNA